MIGRKSGLTAAAAIGTLALGLAACGGGSGGSSGSDDGKPKKGGILKVVGAGGQDNLDPTSAYSTVSSALQRTYSRQLFAYPASKDPKAASTPVPDVAASMPTLDNGGISKDGLTYKIQLRHGVMWNSSPAREMVAGDFVRAFKHMCNPASPVGAPNYYVPNIKGMQSYCDPFLKDKKLQQDAKGIADYENGHEISGVKALDNYTIQFDLTKPASDFISLLAMTFASAVPVEYYQYIPGSVNQFKHLVSAGPYQITSYDPNKSITMDKNPNWKADTDPLRHQYVDKIQVTEGQGSPEAVQQQLEGGTSADISLDQPVPASALGRLAAKNDPNLTVNGPPISNPYLVFNLKSPNEKKAMQNLKVRQAIEYAINKVALAKVYGGPKYNTPLNTIIPPDSVGYQDYNLYPTNGSQGDANKCKQLLSEAGYPNGLKIKAAYRQAGNHPAIFQSYAQDLQACGITVTGVPVPQADFYSQFLQKTDNTIAGKWDVAAPGWVPDWFGNNGRSVVSPLFDGRNWADGTSNYGGYDSPVTNGLIDKALEAKTVDEAANFWHQADQQIMKDAAIVPFMAQKTPWYHSSKVKGATWLPIAQQFDFTNLWLSGS
ncbi:ABC transporter substrate-binding protein [Actinoallomurus purpureus]|uniref:ABC transporter substrate-binding protein n=1 Tax=Actinoallomurus purpureus TaxID=478114 RepID=UPI0020927167|nr:ABC transporter substrate-binding protein [Actinoallomurus purpureus]MCO6007278.1 ABC transporter substrate-binding protein [Actinoallomurus purpureus]